MDLASDCLKLMKSKLSKEISKDEYYLGIMELEKKYPGKGFYDAAQEYAHRNIKRQAGEEG